MTKRIVDRTAEPIIDEGINRFRAERSVDEIASITNLSRERIRQLSVAAERKFCERLKRIISDEMPWLIDD